jgi:DNA polymerase III sliding clamp (beta) subunit (PCNA family)
MAELTTEETAYAETEIDQPEEMQVEDAAEIEVVEKKTAEKSKIEQKKPSVKEAKEEPKRAFVAEGSVNTFTTAKFSKPKILQEFLKGVNALCGEVILKFDKEGLHVISMDPANIAMVVGDIPKYQFQELEVGENPSYALNTGNLKALLARADKDSSVSLRFGDKLDIIIQGKNIRKQFAMRLLADVEEKAEKLPDLKFTAVVELPTKDFEESLKDCDIVGESVIFSVTDGKFNMSSRGDLQLVNLALPGTVKIEGDAKNIVAKYSLEYLQKMILKASDKVKISFGRNYPLRMDYSNLEGKITFVLAPRVDND